MFACQHYQILKPVQQLPEFLSTRNSTTHVQRIIMPCINTVIQYTAQCNRVVFFAQSLIKPLWHPWHSTTLNFSLRAFIRKRKTPMDQTFGKINLVYVFYFLITSWPLFSPKSKLFLFILEKGVNGASCWHFQNKGTLTCIWCCHIGVSMIRVFIIWPSNSELKYCKMTHNSILNPVLLHQTNSFVVPGFLERKETLTYSVSFSGVAGAATFYLVFGFIALCSALLTQLFSQSQPASAHTCFW